MDTVTVGVGGRSAAPHRYGIHRDVNKSQRSRGVDAAREGGARADAAEGELSRTTDPHRYGIHREVNKRQCLRGAEAARAALLQSRRPAQ